MSKETLIENKIEEELLNQKSKLFLTLSMVLNEDYLISKLLEIESYKYDKELLEKTKHKLSSIIKGYNYGKETPPTIPLESLLEKGYVEKL